MAETSQVAMHEFPEPQHPVCELSDQGPDEDGSTQPTRLMEPVGPL